MRNALRFLFIAAIAAILAAVWSGSAFAAIPGSAATPTVAAVSPRPGQTVGIGAPVTLTFTAPVANRAKAESALAVTNGDSAFAGSFTWLNDSRLQWTPQGTLPTNSPISVGFGGLHTQFQTNSGTYADANLSTHTFTVSQGGNVVRVMPASMGKPGWETPTGSFPVLEKFASLVFDSRTIGIPLDSPEGYLINGEWAERLTWGGVFVHSAPWSVDSQGNANVSHGCINLAPGDAQWYYENVGIGDIVNVHY
ncbi:L,D-transpeptidase [Nocardia camponoti]|uniref:Membrane protein n=1 Tax=Nocardia camponoti TaxID=1616106 RepID=A0A917V4C6_9NOCA|nr:L,D-transpeptidase [Nocardia camponoti]GGK37995.1 membrane protein [Nocardia camponoti]